MSNSRQAAAKTVYVVERAAYAAWDFGSVPHFGPSDGEEGPSFTPVWAFADRAEAETCRAALEAEARATFPPAPFFGYELTDELPAKLKMLGLPDLRFTGRSYEQGDEFRRWWADHANDITPQQRAAVWGLLGDVSFYRVTESTLET